MTDVLQNALAPGTILEGKSRRYLIDKVLGCGSFGITYLAYVVFDSRHLTKSSIKVTVKEFFMKQYNGRSGNNVIVASNNGYFEKYLGKFIQEAFKLSKLNSGGIVKVLEAFQSNNTAYYVMQYLPGGSLNDLISKKGPLPEGVALYYGLQMASALKDLHSEKMLHLDLKPSNVMLDADSDAVIIDFGISKQYNNHNEPESSTTIGAGTQGYAPIEQANYHDGHDFPVTMDIYALGATLFKMACGSVPPDSSVILNDGFPEHRFSRLNVSSDFIGFVRQMMSPMKKDRPQSMAEVISIMKRLSGKNGGWDKRKVLDWMNVVSVQKTLRNDDDSETEIEVISVAGESGSRDMASETFSFGRDVTEIEIRIITEPEKDNLYDWITLVLTDKRLTVTKCNKGGKWPEKKTFFYSEEKFDRIKQRLSRLNLSAGPTLPQKGTSRYGVGIKVSGSLGREISAATFPGFYPRLLEGDTQGLANLAWREAGLINPEGQSPNYRRLSAVMSFLASPSKWIGYAGVIGIVALVYFLCDPWGGYMSRYKPETDALGLVMPYASDHYQLRADQGGTGGVVYVPSRQWVVPPKYMRSNPDDVYIPNDSFSLEGVKITDQVDEFAWVQEGYESILFYRGKEKFRVSGVNSSDIGKIHQNLYRIRYEDYTDHYINAVYDKSGAKILPLTEANIRIVGNNEIKVEDGEKSSYYDLTGRPIETFNIVIADDKYRNIINGCFIVILSVISCFVAYLFVGLYRGKQKYLSQLQSKLPEWLEL